MEGSNDIENLHIPLVTSMRGVLDRLPPLSSEYYCCINRVPERLRCGNAKAYTPQVVSIGPLHHGKESLKAMEEHKNRYLRDFLGRTNVSLEVYVRKVKDQEARLRSCYAETIKFSSDEFVRIILVDAAFIIELLLRFKMQSLDFIIDFTDENDPLFGKQKMWVHVWPDMKLLENQLPFFILEDLYDPNKTGTEPSLIELSYNFFKGDPQLLTRKCPTKAEHFVDLIRTLYLPLKPQAGRQRRTVGAPSVTELHRAGVKFKVGSTENIFDIQFADGILKIPKLNIDDGTELTIRNLVAFEQCHCMGNYMIISDYVFIMDKFVNTSRDVELLVKYGIFDNLLGDNNKVSTLINNLGIGVGLSPHNFYYATLCEALNEYCRAPMHIWKANLRQKYFNTPWTTVSVIAAGVLLILTLIQTVCSIISVT